MNYEEEKKRYISFCGSCCHTCDWFTGKIRKTFQSALDATEQYGFSKLLQGKADRKHLKRSLEVLAHSGICSGCKAEIGKSPEEERCQIRQCASSKGFDLCSRCSDFPCDTLRNNPGVLKFGRIDNLKEIKEKGLGRWIANQWSEFVKEQRLYTFSTGFDSLTFSCNNSHQKIPESGRSVSQILRVRIP